MNPIRLTINGESIMLTAWNTTVFVFPETLDKYNHVFIQREPEDEEGFYLFNRNDVVQMLINNKGYPICYLPLVPDPDLEAYKRWKFNQTNNLPLDEPSDISEDEVARYIQEFQEGTINWDELEGGDS